MSIILEGNNLWRGAKCLSSLRIIRNAVFFKVVHLQTSLGKSGKQLLIADFNKKFSVSRTELSGSFQIGIRK